MVITSDNVSMASSRNYRRSTNFSRNAFEWSMNGFRARARADSYISGSTYEERNNYIGSDNYNNFARLNASQGRADNLRNSSLTTGRLVPNGSEADNLEANATTLRVSYLNLLDMIREASFKRLFMGNRTYNRLSGNSMSVSFGQSNNAPILSLTSSSSPTVWYRVEQNSNFMEEQETTAFCSKGTVNTADGRSIDFNVSFEMSRSYTESAEYTQFSQYEQILTDPLVINLNSNPTSITDKKFYFDLDCDGEKEEISELASGNGYLALDLNGDGVINDGSELFGTKSGNGFADLAKYDADGNGWIDEADSVYSKLKVWTKDENGKDVLLSLSEADVGAICLTSSKTPFALKDEDGKLNGMVRQSGIYLTESGKAKTLQQVDF